MPQITPALRNLPRFGRLVTSVTLVVLTFVVLTAALLALSQKGRSRAEVTLLGKANAAATPGDPPSPHAVEAPLKTHEVDSTALERAVVARFAHQPLAQVLRRRTDEPRVANRIARAVLREAKRLRVAPSLLIGMLLIENPRLDAGVVSSHGAIGLMQVMQFHAGEYGCESDDLFEIEANICHGARVLGRYLKRTTSLRTALLRYNGCVRSSNTPHCHRYPTKVLRKAGQVQRMVLEYAKRNEGKTERRNDGRTKQENDGTAKQRSEGRTERENLGTVEG